jgi:hypothetical protein
MRGFTFFVCCICAGFSYAQNVGIGTTTPGSGLELKGPGLASQQRITDPVSGNSLVLQGGAGANLKVTGYNYNTFVPQPLYISVDGANTFINAYGGQVGIGTTTPLGGYLLDVAGPVRSFGSTTHFVAQTLGGTNTWARFYMRSSSQSWFIGTSQNFNGNQLYFGDETYNRTRFSIQPGNGPINMQGHVTQDLGGNGLPKAMVYLNSNGTIGRCYNGISGISSGGCGFSAARVNAGNYQVNFGFDITQRFFAVTPEQPCCYDLVSVSYAVFAPATINVGVVAEATFLNDQKPVAADRPIMIIVY